MLVLIPTAEMRRSPYGISRPTSFLENIVAEIEFDGTGVAKFNYLRSSITDCFFLY